MSEQRPKTQRNTDKRPFLPATMGREERRRVAAFHARYPEYFPKLDVSEVESRFEATVAAMEAAE